MPEDTMLEITTTSDNRQLLLNLAEELQRHQLAACCHIDETPMTSIYRWKGQTDRSQEFRCVIKSFPIHFEAISKLIRASHNYECPPITAHSLTVIDPDYLAWAQQSCGLSPESP